MFVVYTSIAHRCVSAQTKHFFVERLARFSSFVRQTWWSMFIDKKMPPTKGAPGKFLPLPSPHPLRTPGAVKQPAGEGFFV